MERSTDANDHEYVVGQDNIRVFGLDIHNPVFMVSASLVVAFVVGTLIFLDSAGAAFSDLRVWITTKFDWTFMISMNVFVVFSLFIACSKLGSIRLGGKDAKHLNITKLGLVDLHKDDLVIFPALIANFRTRRI